MISQVGFIGFNVMPKGHKCLVVWEPSVEIYIFRATAKPFEPKPKRYSFSFALQSSSFKCSTSVFKFSTNSEPLNSTVVAVHSSSRETRTLIAVYWATHVKHVER